MEKSIFNELNDLIFIITKKSHKILNVNNAVLKTLNYDKKDLIKQNIINFFFRKHCFFFKKTMFSEKKKFFNFVKKNKEKVLCETKIIEQNNEIILICKDISVEKFLEEKFIKTFHTEANMASITRVKDGKILDINKTLLDFIGFQREEIIGKTTTKINVYDNRKQRELLIKELKEKGKLKNFEVKLKSKNGKIIYGLLHSEIIKIDEEDYFLTVVNDITDRKNAEKKIETELKKNLEQQKFLSKISLTFNSLDNFEKKTKNALDILGKHTDVSRVYIFEDDKGGESTSNIFEWCNNGIEKQIDDLQNVPYTMIPSWKKMLLEDKIVFTENIQELPEDLRAIFEPQEIKSIVVLPIYVSKKYFGFIGFDECVKYRNWTKTEIELLRTISNIISNAYERKIIENSLQESEEKTTAILDAIPDLLFHFNKEGKFLDYKVPNDENILSIKPNLFLNKKVSDVFHLSFSEQVKKAINKTILKGKYVLEYEMPVDNILKYFEARFVKLKNNEVISIIRDVSESKEYEKKLKIEKEKAEQASLAKSIFLANMSHEIRTPMNAILGFSEFLLGKINNKEYKNYLEAILISGKSLLSLINDILDLSKIESGKLSIIYEAVHLETIFKEISQIFKQKVNEKKLSFHLKIDEKLPQFLMMDEVRIRQILFNLVGNAVKFTNVGFIKLYVHGVYFDKLRSWTIYFEIHDTGIGIEKKDQELIFEAFEQQSGQDARKYGGTGLGLAITKKLVRNMKGEIKIKSELGKGSVFKVILPNLQEVENVNLIEKNFFEYKKNEKIHFESAKVMIVDDIYYNIESLKKLIDSENISFIEADCGEKALSLLETQKVDMIFMDLRMEGISGYETTLILKEKDNLKNIPVIIFTASSMQEEEKNLKELFDGYLRKPVNKKEVYHQLMKYLNYEIIKNTEEKEEEKMEIIDDKLKEKLPELVEILEKEYIPIWEELKTELLIFEMEDFANNLLNLSKNYPLSSLTNYADTLMEKIETFDIDQIEKFIKKFSTLVMEIKKLIKK